MRHYSVLLPSTLAVMLGLAACERETAQQPAVMPEPVPATEAEGVPSEDLDPPTATPAPVTQGEQGGTDDWRKVISAGDRDRLTRIDEAWDTALAHAVNDGHGAEVKALGALAVKGAASEGQLQPPPGTYRCRTIKLGAKGELTLTFSDYPYFRCRVELTPGGDLILTKTTGSQRFRGLLYPDTNRQLVYIGAQSWGDEKGYPAYGANAERDEAGVLQRIGNNQWRLVIPFPKQESQLDIIEIVR